MPIDPSQLKELPIVVALAVVFATAFVIVIGMVLKSHKEDVKILKEIIEKKDAEQKEMNKENGEMHKGKLVHFTEEARQKDEMIKTLIVNHLEKSTQSNEKFGEMIRLAMTKFSDTINELRITIERFKIQK